MPEVETGGFEDVAKSPLPRHEAHGRGPESFEHLRRMVEGDLLPRLLLIHHAGPIPPRLAARAASVLPSGEYDRFIQLVLGHEPDETVSGFVEDLLDGGHTLDAVYVDLFAPAARQLGVMWSEDSCDFVEVTLACCQMQRVIRRVGRHLVTGRPRNTKGLAVVAALAGEQHTLGAILVAEILGQDGWDVALGEPFGPMTDLQGVRLLAFSLARVDRWEEARDRIARLRDMADPDLQVMVGGAAFLERPGLVSRVGADGWAEDGKAVRALADRLCLA
jgi:methanogenic corrinoid protein MtbC1